jgi:acyl-CoA reductase-like NAD-dependent aldehyde dehydrogenase
MLIGWSKILRLGTRCASGGRPRVQSHLSAELAELTKQAVSAPLQGGRSRPQDPETGTIQSMSLSVSFSY